MLPFRLAKFVAAKATKPSLYAALIGSFLWLAIDLADGASDRFHARLDQVKVTVGVPAENAANKTGDVATKLWGSVEDNPGPSLLALALFIVTVIYHKRKGTSTVEALKATILKTVPAEPVNPVLQKIQREAFEGQLLEAYDRLETRDKALPAEIASAEANEKQRETAMNKVAEAAERARQEYQKARSYREKLAKEFADGKVAMLELEAELAKAA